MTFLSLLQFETKHLGNIGIENILVSTGVYKDFVLDDRPPRRSLIGMIER